MNKDRIEELASQAYSAASLELQTSDPVAWFSDHGPKQEMVNTKFAELIIKECISQVEQAKNSPFVSLDDANRMKHFVDVTKKKIVKHFGIDS